jgi:hypothetical protein
MKAKLKGAETGHSLLKRKSEALTKYVFSTVMALAIAGGWRLELRLTGCARQTLSR